MRLQTKISLVIFPFVVLATFILGYLFFRSSSERIQALTLRIIEDELDNYTDHISNDLHRILKKIGLDRVDSFVSRYQEYAIQDTVNYLRYFETGHFLILTPQGDKIHCSRHPHMEPHPEWKMLAERVAREQGERIKGFGKIMSSEEEIYVGRYFDPWKWVIVYAVSEKEVNKSWYDIRGITLTVGPVCLVLGFSMTFLIFRILFVRPVSVLKETARLISRKEPVESIPVHSSDELGELARSMEAMSRDLSAFHREQENWQKHLEEQVALRTGELRAREDELKEYAENQAVLLREVNHRVKNNLTAIIGILHMEEDRAVGRRQEEFLPVLRDLEGRISGLVTVHDMLSMSRWQPLLLQEVCEGVIQATLDSMALYGDIEFRVSPSSVKVDARQAHHLALVLNELTTNCLKHGGKEEGNLRIFAGITAVGDRIFTRFEDTGPGFPESLIRGDFSCASTGIELIRGIVTRSMQGELKFENAGGAVAILSFRNELMSEKGEGETV